ncbi:hypothetical protein COU54_04450 [Candidatus Pacearchaeota archaeon CG10_big_fil_rev_8_21_14_0_10_31_24]|nr:MAG: hypothetical protein COU54_04450 [Candidatus Pacearchaeota archaeon CG10_big_fil_rev_8_21_14_0_10_31_24]
MVRQDKLLITGAGGFIGQKVVNYFLGKGYRVRAFVRKKNLLLKNSNLEIVYGDMRDYDSLDKACKGMNFVIHLAGAKSDEKDSYNINVNGAKNLIKAGKSNKIKRIVNISTESVYLVEKGAYAKTKLEADELFNKSGLDVITLRPSVVYGDLKNGVFGSLVKFASLPVTPVIGFGKYKFRPIYIEDLAKSIEISISHKSLPEKIYDVGSREGISMNDLIKKISKEILKKKPRILHLPVSIGYGIHKTLSLVSNKPIISESNILGSTQEIKSDSSKYFRDFFIPRDINLGFKEIISKRDNLAEEFEVLSRYILSSCDSSYLPMKEDIEKYSKALKIRNINKKRFSEVLYNYPFLIGGLDAISRILYPKGSFQKKLNIVAILIECHPVSAKWLLPKERSFISLVWRSSLLILRSIIKFLLGILLLLVPNFVEKNAK